MNSRDNILTSLRLMVFFVLILFSQSVFTQVSSASFGNTFIHSEGNMTAFDNHIFDTITIGTLPGIIGAERLPARGYFNFAPNCSWQNATNGKFIDGYVRFFGNNKFLFPIGDNGKFRPAAISGGSFVEACYYDADPTAAITSDLKGGNYPVLPLTGPFNSNLHDNTLTTVSEYEYWDINGTDATIITLTWDAQSNISAITSGELSTLTIAGWDGTEWVNIPSSIDPNSISLTDNTCQFNGPPSTLNSGSISTNIAIVPSAYEVYTFASNCTSMTVDVSPDTLVCLGNTVTLEASSLPGAFYSWDSGHAGASINVSPSQNTTYTVTAAIGACTATNNVFVEVSETAVDLGPDMFSCLTEQVTITALAPGNNNTFQWSTGYSGGNQLVFTPDNSQTVSVTVTNEYGCTATDEMFLEVRPKPNVFTGRDRSLCLGDSVFIQAFGSPTGQGYLWSTGETSATINVSPNVTTTYEVYLTDNGCVDTADVTVAVLPSAFIEIISDTLICEGETITLETNATPGEYAWSNGQQTPSITVTPTDGEIYSVTITSNEDCQYYDSVEIDHYDASYIDVVEVVSTCPGEPVTFTAGGIYDSVQWSDGSTGTTFTVSPTVTTTYSVTGFYRGCSATKDITVEIVNDLQLDLGPDIAICSGDQVTFNLDTISGSYIWSTGETTAQITVSPNIPTSYSVTITSGSCQIEDEIFVDLTTTGCLLDLSAGKEVNDSNPAFGDTINFTVTIANTSAFDASNIIVLEELQTGFQFLSDFASHGNYDELAGEWFIPELLGGQTATLTIEVIVLSTGIYTNTVEIDDLDQDDDNPDNDEEAIEVEPYDPSQTGSAIGDYVWWDEDGDGVQDFNEDGIQNIEVELYNLAAPQVPQMELMTDENGYFCFTNLNAGEYFVKFIIPDSLTETKPMVSLQGVTTPEKDSDITHFYGNGTTDMIAIGENVEIKSCDGGLHKWSSIGDLAWFDSDSGIENRYDENLDNPYTGLEINLYDADTDEWLDVKITDANGLYLFDKLKPGNYYLKIDATPPGLVLVPPFGGPSHLDSDFIYPSVQQRDTGTTLTINLGVEEDNSTIDAGLINGTVPINLLDFWGERIVDESYNKLFWITEMERNSDYFILERSIDDVLGFEPIGTVEAAGSSSETLYYSFDDLDSRFAATYYYRLISVDFDGSETYSKIISIKVDEDADDPIVYRVYPIPTSDFINIEITINEDKTFQGYLINNLGQNVRKLQKRFLSSGRTLLTLDLNDLAQGQYYLNFYINEQQYISKILVMD